MATIAPQFSIFESRRAFNAGLAALEKHLDSPLQLAPEAVWQGFNDHLSAAFALQSEAVWRCGLHPLHRARVARLFCEVGRAKMQLDPHGDPATDPFEARLWSAALTSSPRAVAAWQAEVLAAHHEFGFGFSHVKHRLADLHRRAGRTDDLALRLYIEVFTGRGALPVSRLGAGSHHAVGVLLERGAALSEGSSQAEVEARYSLCLLLWNRHWSAPWVGRSLQIAREKRPSTLARLDERRGYVEIRRHKVAQKPAIAALVEVLKVVAQTRFEQEFEVRWAQIEREKEHQAEIEALASIQTGVEEPINSTKRKRGRPRKSAAAVERPLAPPLETLPDAPPPAARPALLDAAPGWEENVDLDTIFRSEPPQKVLEDPASKPLPLSAEPPGQPPIKAIDNEWLDFDFDFDK